MNGPDDKASWVGPGEALGELARRTAMLDAVGYAASRIVLGENWENGIQELLNRLGHATGASRVSLFEIHRGPDNRLVENCRYDWTEPGQPPMSTDPRYRDIALEEADGTIDDWTLRRQRGEVVQAKLRELSGLNRQIFEETSTLSFISVPIMLRSGCWGFLALDDCHVERDWTALEIDVLRTAAALVAGALERARADEQLRLSETRLRTLSDDAPVLLCMIDPQDRLIFANSRFLEFFGRTLADIAKGGWNWEDDIHPADLPQVRTIWGDALRNHRSVEFEHRVKRHDGEYRWVHETEVARFAPDGAFAGFVGALVDITDRKRAETALRASEARARAILDTAFDAVISIDETGEIVEFNQAASRIFGFSRDAAIGRPLTDLIIPPVQRAAHDGGLKRYLATGQSRIIGKLIEVAGLRADGSLVPVELSITEVPLPRGRLFTAILRDIAERKRIESQLSDAQRQRAVLARHFSPNMVEEMMRTGGQLDDVRTQPITVMFVDMFNFTELSAGMPPTDVVGLLRSFHALVEEAVFGNDGTLDKYMGDGVMATFGTPWPGPRDATNAVAAARAMVRGINRWNLEREATNRLPLRLGIGLHHGEATLGNVGSARRFEHTIVGETVNMASRIENLTRVLDIAILASGSVIEAVRREGGELMLAGIRELGTHAIRGHKKPVALWGLTAAEVATVEPTDGMGSARPSTG